VSCSARADTKAPDLEALKKGLVEDTQHMFGEKGIDASVYAPRVMFRDPITKYDDIDVRPCLAQVSATSGLLGMSLVLLSAQPSWRTRCERACTSSVQGASKF